MSARSYVGRHRAPVPPGAARVRVVVAGAAVAAPLLPLLTAGTASAAEPPGGWGPYILCESGGRVNASNGSHFGLFQFDLPTWRSVGGTGNPGAATAAEQTMRAGLLFARRGSQPWLASASCRARHAGAAVPVLNPRGAGVTAPVTKTAPVTTTRAVPAAPTPRRVIAAPAPARGHLTVRRGDTVSQLSAARGGARITGMRSGNPNLIYPGERLNVA